MTENKNKDVCGARKADPTTSKNGGCVVKSMPISDDTKVGDRVCNYD